MTQPGDFEERLGALLDARDLDATATEIIQQYGPQILGYLSAMLRDDGAAREAFSEFAEELWKALPRFERRSSFKTWAYAVAYRCALRFRRAAARRRTRPLRDSEYSKIAQTARSVAQTFSRTEAERKLDVLRQTLDDEEQTLLVLRLDRGMSWQEVAEVLGVDGGAGQTALRKRFQRLKERLRQRAEEEGLIQRSGQ